MVGVGYYEYATVLRVLFYGIRRYPGYLAT